MREEDEGSEDVIVENRQASEMAKIYTDILTGMMDAFTSVISNNLNRVMKLLPPDDLPIPTIVGSLFGMNLALPLSHTASYSFWVIIAISVAVSAVFALVFWRTRFF
jgi:magnesium transporter